MVLFRCLQHMNEIYKICVLICFHKSDVINLTLFSTKNLLEVTSVTLVLTYLENIFHTVLLSIYSANVVWRKEIFWILLFQKCSSHLSCWYCDWRMCCRSTRTMSRTLVFPSPVSLMYSSLHVEQMTTYIKSLLLQVISSLR